MATAPDTVTVRAGGEAVLSLSQDVLDVLGVKAGTVLHAVSTPAGLLLKTADASNDAAEADFAEAMEAFERISERYKNTLRELAK